MSYTTRNFKSKKELKAAIAAGEVVTAFQPGIGPDLTNYTGKVYLEGPHYPAPHKWYAEGTMVNGRVVSVS